MTALQELAKKYLSAEHNFEDGYDYAVIDPTTRELLGLIYSGEFKGIERVRERDEVMLKPTELLTYHEVCVCIFSIFMADRTSEGTIDEYTDNGKIPALLKRCLEVDPEPAE